MRGSGWLLEQSWLLYIGKCEKLMLNSPMEGEKMVRVVLGVDLLQ